MNILISSHAYAPSVGGIESVTEILAREWIRQGHEVRIITRTPGAEEHGHTIPVIRNLTPRELIKNASWCDIYFQNNISVGTLWAGLLCGKAVIITHQTWISRGVAGMVKRLFIRMARSRVAISSAVAAKLQTDQIIPNPYRDEVFKIEGGEKRDREILFVGRLVPDKGCDLLLDALCILAEQKIHPLLSIVGSGSEEPLLRKRVQELGLESQVLFLGVRHGNDLASEYRRHKILVIPSRWEEPFGIVALEGIACGCRIVAADTGGLPEAVGPFGKLFRSGDTGSLAKALQLEFHRAEGSGDDALMHLQRHRPGVVALEYLSLFSRLLESNPRLDPIQ